MSWKDAISKQRFSDDIAFMREMLNEVITKVGNIYGLVPKQIAQFNYKGFPAGYYYSPEAVIEYAFNVGFEDDVDGFVVDEDITNMSVIENHEDWNDMWGFHLKDDIMRLPEKYRDLGSKEDYPVYQYIIGAYDYNMPNIGIFVKKENPQVESLVMNIHKKYEDRFGKGKSSYEPEFPMAYSTEEGKNITPEEATPKDNWKDSLRGKE